MSTYTQEQMDAAIAAAVAKATSEATASLQSKLDALEAASKESEVGKAVEAAVAEAITPLQSQVSDLQKQLDDATVARTAAETAKAEVEAFWADAVAKAEQEQTVAARKDERIAKIRDAKVFDDAYIEANADRFAAMSDEDFAARMEEWAAAVPKTTTFIPTATALTAARQDGAPANQGSALSELKKFRGAFDPRTL